MVKRLEQRRHRAGGGSRLTALGTREPQETVILQVCQWLLGTQYQTAIFQLQKGPKDEAMALKSELAQKEQEVIS